MKGMGHFELNQFAKQASTNLLPVFRSMIGQVRNTDRMSAAENKRATWNYHIVYEARPRAESRSTTPLYLYWR